MLGIDRIGNWVLVIMALTSLISMIAAFNLDIIVHQDLYSYGLQFSLDWANPYWSVIRIIFAMGWLNIIIAIAFQVYRMKNIRSDENQNE